MAPFGDAAPFVESRAREGFDCEPAAFPAAGTIRSSFWASTTACH